MDTIKQLIVDKDIKYIDLRFTDTIGRDQHITLPIQSLDATLLTNGKMFDGSSIRGWQNIHESDLTLIPDLTTTFIDPFYQDPTLIIRCNVQDPISKQSYRRCPRAIAMRAEAYLQSTGIADYALFGPEPEFFLFDDVRFANGINSAFYTIDAEEGCWNSGKKREGGNTAHRPALHGGYFPLPPVDSSQDIRAAMCNTLSALGIVVEAHHHEVGTANQCEIATRYNTLTKKADELQLIKYVVQNVAHHHGKTATFMPKPLVGENGNGMHCHQSLIQDGQNLFAGSLYAGLSETALYYIGGILHHARALNVFTNPAINSYKRLIPGFEAPVMLAYSARNRAAAIRIPANTQRIEVRFPDPCANPYLAFTAMLLAGLDGIQRKLHPGDPMEIDLYASPNASNVPQVAESLSAAIAAVKVDNEFLFAGNVFDKDILESYIALRQADIDYIKTLVHPAEFELYYSA